MSIKRKKKKSPELVSAIGNPGETRVINMRDCTFELIERWEAPGVMVPRPIKYVASSEETYAINPGASEKKEGDK